LLVTPESICSVGYSLVVISERLFKDISAKGIGITLDIYKLLMLLVPEVFLIFLKYAVPLSAEFFLYNNSVPYS